jgi:hypothetical protein
MEHVKIMVTVKEFSRLSGLGERKIREICRMQGFPAFRNGKKIEIHRELATKWLADYTMRAAGRV